MSWTWTTARPGELLREEPPAAVLDPCICGHAKAGHEHYRPGADCGSCGPSTCPQFRRPPLLKRLVAALTRR